MPTSSAAAATGRACAAALIAVVLCAVFGHRDSFAFWEDDLLYEGESVYNYLQVKETEDSVILSTNVLFGVQSVRQKDGGLTGMYYDTALAAPLMAGIQEKDTFDILILGMGSGTYAAQCQEFFGGREDLRLTIEGVEIDQDITDLGPGRTSPCRRRSRYPHMTDGPTCRRWTSNMM